MPKLGDKPTGKGVVVIDGPDGSGKTTLIGHLVRIFNFTPTKLGGPPADDVEGMERLVLVNSLSQNVPWIFDRLPMISEQVYGPVLRGATRPQLSLVQTALQTFINKYDPFIVICQSPTGSPDSMVTTEKSWKPAELRDEVAAKFADVIAGYRRVSRDLEQMLDRSIPRLMYFNHRIMSPWSVVHRVGSYVEQKRPNFWYPGEE